MAGTRAALVGAIIALALVCSVSAERQYRIVMGYDIPGQDIPSGGKPYTKFCTGVNGYKGKYGYDAYKLACDETPKCVAATAPATPDGCAYLKAAGKRADTRPDPKWVVVTSQEPPQKPCVFVPLGGKCNTNDAWVSTPLCCGGNKNPCKDGVCVSGYPSGRRMAAL